MNFWGRTVIGKRSSRFIGAKGAEGTLRRPVCYVESTKSEIVAYSPLPTAIEVAINSRPMVFQTPLWSSYHSTDEATAL